jgi:hypothetical protein
MQDTLLENYQKMQDTLAKNYQKTQDTLAEIASPPLGGFRRTGLS